MKQASRFDNRVALITGGGSGIGRACALKFASQGAKVVIADIHMNGEETRAKAEELGVAAIYVQIDVTDGSKNMRMIDDVLSAFGRLDILVPAAGIGGGGNVVDISEVQWDFMLDLDLKSVYLSCKYAIPAMIESGGGSVVTIGSLGSFLGNSAAHFAAAKGGVLNLSRSMAVAYAKDNIRVNCVCPGYIKTPILGGLLNDEIWLKNAADSAPMGRMGKAEEVAAAVAFLASDEASFITGATLNVDGGYLAQGKF